MLIDTLYIQHVRNVEGSSFSFVPGINHFYGGNGEGKTAILEAIHLLIVGTSFRTHQMKELVQRGKSHFFIEASLLLNGVIRRLSLSYDGNRRVIAIDGAFLPSSSLLFGTILGVTATPEDCDLIYGTPAERRRFIDQQIAQIDPTYVLQMKRLQRSLQQRNALLKEKGQMVGIEAWEDRIAHAAAYITLTRYQTVCDLIPFFEASSLRKTLGSKSDIVVTYAPSVVQIMDILQSSAPKIEKEQSIVHLFKKTFNDKRMQEIKAGTTLYGPQRDDLQITWNNGVAVKTEASLGQAKTIALLLRIAEWELLSSRSQQGKPLFLIDDLHSFLDDAAVESTLRLAEEKLGQVCMTSHRHLCKNKFLTLFDAAGSRFQEMEIGKK